ncbi:MAG TPA: hypothetical protein VFV93_17515 [Thermomicrobiales bacterium]|nr:hypothetical protein [Thermomicrobiales bacterium]
MNRLLANKYQPWIVAVLFVVVTIWMTWPLTPHATRAVQDPGDPLFEIWVMRTVQHRLVHNPLDLYDSNAFYPFDDSLAYSEEAISTALLAWPVYLLTGNDVLAYNVVLLSAFWLVAFAVYLLARELGASPGAAFVAGILASFAPARYAHLSHLHMLVIGWLPLALWALTRYVRGGRDRYLVLVAVALAIEFLASLHMAVFSTLVLALYLPFLLWFERRERGWERPDLLRLAAALIVPYLVLAPTLLPHVQAGHEYKMSRPRWEVEALSSEPSAYISTYVTNGFWNGPLRTASEPFFPGLVALAGALLALLVWRRWWVWFAAALTVAAAVISFGFDIELAGRTITMPYALVYKLVPPIRDVRGVGRFGLLTAIGLPLLAAFGYSALWRRIRDRAGEYVVPVGVGLTALLAVVACIELRAPARIDAPPDARTMAVYDWLADQPDGPVAEFPANGLLVPTTQPPGGLFQPIQYMYGSTRHWKPILSGYSGFIPAPHIFLMNHFDNRDDPGRQSMVTERNVGLLQELDIRWVVFHRLPTYDIDTALALADTLPELRRVTEVGNSVVYELTPETREPLPAEATTVEIRGDASAGGLLPVHFNVTNPHDNLSILHFDALPDLTSRWRRDDGSVAKTERFEVPIPTVVNPGSTSIEALLTAPDEPGIYTVEISLDRTDVADASRQVEVDAAVIGDNQILRLESVDWDRSASPQPGDHVQVEVTWAVLERPSANFSATLQLLNAAGERVAGSDLLPGAGMPPTSEWTPGQRVTLSFDLVIDAGLPPGDYQLLTAVYAYRPDFPRLRIERTDGTTATEAILPGFTIGR